MRIPLSSHGGDHIVIGVSLTVAGLMLLRRTRGATANELAADIAASLADAFGDSFDAGYRLCQSHYRQGAGIPRPTAAGAAERHGH